MSDPAHSTATSQPDADGLELLQQQIEHAAHYLPSQGPITAFVHHNTLHAYEEMPFEQAVIAGWERYRCQPYLSEAEFRDALKTGRMTTEDISAVLIQDLGDRGDVLLGPLGSRYHLWESMLECPFQQGTDAEIRWLLEEGNLLDQFDPATPAKYAQKTIQSTRRWLMEAEQATAVAGADRLRNLTRDLLPRFGKQRLERLNEAAWEKLTLRLLWRICQQGVHGLPRFHRPEKPLVRHRDILWYYNGIDIDREVNQQLIRFCSVYVDQGFANWQFPAEQRGIFQNFLNLFRNSRPVEAWLSDLPRELQRIETLELSPLAVVEESLRLLGVTTEEQEEYLLQTLLALRGWAGMIWQLETNTEWAYRPALPGSLVGFLAIRLLLERLRLNYLLREQKLPVSNPQQFREQLSDRTPHQPRIHQEQRAFLLFQLAQHRGWTPAELFRLKKIEWSQIVEEMEAFHELERRRIFQLAYERNFRLKTLSALKEHQRLVGRSDETRGKSFQIITCIDDREESFRRHLEEIEPTCQTFGSAGFFAIPMYYRGAADAYFRPLCPNVIKPKHYVKEIACYSLSASSRQRAETRKTIGTAGHHLHLQSRSLGGGMLTSLLGTFATVPLITQILFPHFSARIQRIFGSLFVPPPVTELTLNRLAEPAGSEDEHLGYRLDEMADSVERVLRDIGLTKNFAPIVMLVGHGSSSLNNPHESAYNCGACSGGRGGPNARAFALMANHRDVRQLLAERGLPIPIETIFVGGYHNTCDEEVLFYDLDRIPFSHRRQFEVAREVIDLARERNALERCRRFESASLELTAPQALEHVQTRSEDLSQSRPEYNHATNTLCVVGRRLRTRQLFLDRRSFLNDYDARQDDADGKILERILSAVIPVCAGINLEYYFSTVDPAGYGCGSKLPHNIVSLLGVMEGAASDLRTGLSQQMIEIHEPMRILFVIETTPEIMLKIIDRHPVIGRLVKHRWVQLATLQPVNDEIYVYEQGAFVPFSAPLTTHPVSENSCNWFTGRREHLPFATLGLTAEEAN